MKTSITLIVLSCFVLIFSAAASSNAQSEDTGEEKKLQEKVNSLQKPLYSAFTERYILDELKQLRIELAEQKVDYTKQIVDREHTSVDRAVSYATDTVTYFFYLIAAATSVLVLVGWTSIRDIRDRVHNLADEEINTLVKEYESRLHAIEKQLNKKTEHIRENREEIELTNEIHSLWLKASHDQTPANKIEIYDQILTMKPDDVDAMTYKADAALEINEPQWAINLCQKALNNDPDNAHAHYQLACAHSIIGQFDEAALHLQKAISISENYRDLIAEDPALSDLYNSPTFKNLLNNS